MVSKNQIKVITGLQQKKLRHSQGLFTAEGAKVISELLHSRFALEQLYQSEPVFTDIPAVSVTAAELKKMSSLTASNNCLAVFRMAADDVPAEGVFTIVLDDVRDPGNLGTIIRLCDWFGVKQVVCSKESADVYNPKAIQATMGSIARVSVFYEDLEQFLHQKNNVYGTFMDGGNIYTNALPADAIVVFGNEANGISDKIAKQVQRKISIPRFGELQKAESLNVAMATAVVLSEFRRINPSGS